MIIEFGRKRAGNYLELELAACLWRAFIRDRADYVVLDSYMSGQSFVAASVAYAIDKGWLTHTDTRGDEQSEVYEFRLTPAGRAALEALKP